MDQHNPNVSSSSNGSVTPEFEPLPTEETLPGPTFTVLDPTPKLSVEPFSSTEIVEGTAVALVIGLRLESEAEALAFREAFQWVWKPILPTANLLDQLGVGEALAGYGVGKGMGLGGTLDQLPPLARVACGALVLGVAGYMAMKAVRPGRGEVSYGETTTPMDTAGPGPERDWSSDIPPADETGYEAERNGSVPGREAASNAALRGHDHAIPPE